eukprot:527821-Pyramimonas_sp.AAC.1
MPRPGPYGPQPLNWRPPALPNSDDEGPRQGATRRPAAASPAPARADSSGAETSSSAEVWGALRRRARHAPIAARSCRGRCARGASGRRRARAWGRQRA